MRPARRFLQSSVIGGLRLYQGLKGSGLLPRGVCRFLPTCSGYAEAAIRRHGLLKGLRLSAWRILRCHPGQPGGPDQVP